VAATVPAARRPGERISAVPSPPMAASDADDPAEQVRSFALGFPDAYEDHPWEERVV